ncbi:LysR family transcriptional regulator [Marinicellulosiphila megalodicopiae]|uniref:LysR family transcriptional regulator n=1 Tax=Marinicellulosiphila megalodicopiae TaxID=2724896 RepID=UPI003BAFD3C6
MWKYEDISIVVEVIKHGSFIQASKHLSIPSSTVSRRVYALEESLGVQLLDRSSRKIQLTQKGVLFFEKCAPHIQEIKHNIHNLMAQQQEMSGKISVTTTVFLSQTLVGDWLCSFLREHPNLELDIVINNHYQDILNDKIDIAIRVGPLKNSDFIAQYLFTSHFILCASPDYLSNLKNPIESMASLQQEALLLTQQHKSGIRIKHKSSSVSTEHIFETKICANDINIVLKAAINSIGITCLPVLCVSDAIQKGLLVPILPDYEISTSREIYIVYPTKRHLSQKTRTLIDYIKEKSKELDG